MVPLLSLIGGPIHLDATPHDAHRQRPGLGVDVPVLDAVIAADSGAMRWPLRRPARTPRAGPGGRRSVSAAAPCAAASPSAPGARWRRGTSSPSRTRTPRTPCGRGDRRWPLRGRREGGPAWGWLLTAGLRERGVWNGTGPV